MHGQNAGTSTNYAVLLATEGTNVFVAARRSTTFLPATVRQHLFPGDRIRTGERSRATLLMFGKSVARLHEHTDLTIEEPPAPDRPGVVTILKGILYLLHRDKPGWLRFQTVTASAGTRGTEFNLAVDEASGQMILTMIEGEAELRTLEGPIVLHSGEQGITLPGRAPQKAPVINVMSIIQWCLYYPGVLDPAELELTEEERGVLSGSLEAYRRGDLLKALELYPHGRAPTSKNEQLYLAAVLLSAGIVDRAEEILVPLTTPAPGPPGANANATLAAAMLRLMDVVRLRNPPTSLANESSLSTVALVDSYVEQSRGDLRAALKAASRAVERSPAFSFAWTRVAELEFSRGDTRRARSALNQAIALGPNNAQAIALQGFLQAADDRPTEAIRWFDRAIAEDGGLANAWLGRGLCRIRQGNIAGGREDLHVAAALEPQRALLRSYLGKAFHQENDLGHAAGELELARTLDRGDPTPWFYSALLLQEQNRINEAVRDLERSIDLNDHRQLYRSRLLLDQDRAVRGAHLANLYRDAGLTDWGTRQALRAVNDDYANHSSHLFLADSYNQLRDPNQINLRYETPWFSEYLLANLLAPVGAGTLSQTVSQQEYSRLFEQNRLGFASATEYSSRGDWSQAAVHHGTIGSSSYAVEALYQWRNGDRPNNELEQLALDLQFKHQLTPDDDVYFLVRRDDLTAGDVTPYYRPEFANRGLHVEDLREPTVLAGFHHRWGPGAHTLFLASHIDDELTVRNPFQESLWRTSFDGSPTSVQPITLEQQYRSRLEIFSGEIQHIWQQHPNTLIVGARVQGGEIETRNRQSNSIPPTAYSIAQRATSDLLHFNVYGYEQWRVRPALLLIAGLSYDRNEFPANFRYAPITDDEKTVDQWSPKAGLIWTPDPQSTIRAGYARGLGGVGLEQSFRLEPSQVAGFNQSFRSLIPESEAGSQAGAGFDIWGLAIERRWTNTYASLAGDWIESDLQRRFGIVELNIPGGYSAGHTPEALDFRERAVAFSLHQLVGPEWTVGGTYRLGYSELQRRYPEIPAAIASDFEVRQDLTALLHQARLSLVYNNAAGFFGSFDSLWYSQDNRGYNGTRPGDDFWQFNLYAGYRFLRRRAELRLGLLNLSDRDYRLNPLSSVYELPRDRTLTLSLRLNF